MHLWKKLDTTTADRNIKLHNKKLYSILFILFHSSIYYFNSPWIFSNLSDFKRLDSFDLQSALINTETIVSLGPSKEICVELKT